MKQMGFGVAIALAAGLNVMSAASLSGTAAPPQQAKDDRKDVTITGCVVKGDGGYVLTNVAEENTAAAMKAGTPTSPQPKNAILPGRVLYWLEDDDDVKDHAGHKVEVQGELKGEIEKGKISAEREGGLVELEFKVEGEKKVTIKVPDVPAAIGTGSAVGDREKDFAYVVRKIDVGKVKMISSTCQ